MSAPPPAAGVRLDWADLPPEVRAAIEGWLGEPVAVAATQPGGFSPGVAARLQTASGRRVFLKAVGSEPNALSATFHRREITIAGALPATAPAPRLLWSYDEGGWVALLFEDVEGRHPQQPWQPDEFARVMAALADLSAALTPSPVPPAIADYVADGSIIRTAWWERLLETQLPGLDPWSARHLAALAKLQADASEAAQGDTLLHLDLRADNLLLTPERVAVVDWPHARIGAPWIDLIFLAPSVAMQGGPAPETLLLRHPAGHTASPEAVNAVIAAMAGFFTWSALRPPPPGLPTLRAFQDAQGIVARRWLAERMGWD
jgi:aminoglycoside phosphotransferase (APT) family kinase protein